MDADREDPDDPHHLERALATLRARCADPAAGPWGPRSQLWRIAREKCVLVAGGRAALLQLAHPFVGEAVAASDLAVRSPLTRFKRTFDAVYAWVFGSFDDAAAAARRVHRVHRGVRGSLPAVGGRDPGAPYRANDAGALAWVHATLVDSSVLAFEHAGLALTADEREAYWQDSRAFGLLVGLTRLPESWAAFAAYRDRMLDSGALAVTPAAAGVGRRLLSPADVDPALRPVWATYRAMTSRLLPPHLRAPFGLSWGVRDQALAAVAFEALARAYKHVPSRIRCVPAYHEARWRLAGRRSRVDRLGRTLEDAALGLLLREPAGAG